ncbi:MAG TPA: alpha/beta fold hydrolase [Chitinophagaceae bacterium]|nr:alpha/beta fold hydrolase [Chitinophagaceae bacterium]
MIKGITLVFILCYSIEQLYAQDFVGPDTVSVQSGNLTLKGLLWRPAGHGPFPTIIFCHGSYGGADTTDPLQQTSLPGPVFAKKGYIFFVLFRRGVGLSKGHGENSAELMYNAFKEKGQEGRNKVQLQQLEADQLQDMISGLRFLRRRQEVDTNHIAVIGHSFGGSLALLFAEHEPGLKAVIVFAAAGYSWDLSPQLRTRLIKAVKNITVPVMMIHAQNDYSTNPGYALDSIMNKLNKPHILKIYPKFGGSVNEGHNFIFLSIETWEADVFKFLDENLIR